MSRGDEGESDHANVREAETEADYGSASGTAIETVLQSIETANLGTYTISIIGTPTTDIYTYTQRRMKLSQALADVTNRIIWAEAEAVFDRLSGGGEV